MPTSEANRSSLGPLTPKTLQKALYVVFIESGRILHVVCFCWSQFPFPEPPLAGQAGPIYRLMPCGRGDFRRPISAFCFPGASSGLCPPLLAAPGPREGGSAFSMSAFQDFRIPPRTFPFPLLPFRRTIARLYVMGGTIAQSSVGCQASPSGHRPVVSARPTTLIK